MKSFRRIAALALAALGLAAGAARAAGEPADLGLFQEQERIKNAAEAKIQKDVLDPILGPGHAMVFVDVEMEVKVIHEEAKRSGMGLAERYKEKLGSQSSALQTTFIMPGIPKPKTISSLTAKNTPEAAQAQQAQEIKGRHEMRYAVVPVFKKLLVTVLHDSTVLKAKPEQDLVRSRILDAMAGYNLKPNQVVFKLTPFKKIQINWRDDIRRPSVYLPLLYAFLLFLLLGFLFGPLASFFRHYVQALREKPAAEVNVESKIEPEGGGDGGNPLDEEGKLDITLQRKPPETPEEEDESMKKFEPFAYINDENVKRLAYMFLLRKEEPWVIAVVVSYLKPEYARLILTSLPVELQAKVALEALTARQLSREQVTAIDQEVKENVDFVVGGIERLTQLLDEADTATRTNILTYLKNEKPTIYEHVRKFILTFEDVLRFPDRDMQILVRELKPETMARALQNTSPEISAKFLSNMSAGAAALVKEAIEYASSSTPAQIDEERAKIVDEIKRLEREGKIAVREKPETGLAFEGIQEELSATNKRSERLGSAKKSAAPEAAPVDPAQASQAQSYLDAAMNLYQSGQGEQSVPYFQAALSLNPGLWQARQYLGAIFHQAGRTAEALAQFEELLKVHQDPQIQAWVDSLKAQAPST